MFLLFFYPNFLGVTLNYSYFMQTIFIKIKSGMLCGVIPLSVTSVTFPARQEIKKRPK
jgi:hypothetical protein